MICKECGAQIENDAEKCPFCGAVYKEGAEAADENTGADVQEYTDEENIEEPPADGIENDVDEEDPDKILDENEIKRRRQMERMRAEKQSQLEEIERRREDKRKRQRNAKIIAGAVCAVCVVAAAAGGIYMFKNGEDRTVVLSTETPTSTPVVTLPVITPTPAAEASPSTSPDATATPSWQATGGGTTASSGTTGGTSSGTGGGGTSAGTSSSSRPQSGAASGTASSGTSSSGGTVSSTPTTSASSVRPGRTYSAEGGMTDGRFTAALVTGGQVIHDASGRSYMTFNYNGVTYYANVDAASYTEYIAGRPITLSAYPTSEVYNGNTVYEITSITHYRADYIFPNSGFELLTESDLAGKSKSVLALGRNEIYARHGRAFKMEEFSSYFSKCSWYRINPNYNYNDDASNLNAIERANANFIKAYEDKMN